MSVFVVVELKVGKRNAIWDIVTWPSCNEFCHMSDICTSPKNNVCLFTPVYAIYGVFREQQDVSLSQQVQPEETVSGDAEECGAFIGKIKNCSNMHGRVKIHFDDGGIISFGLTHHTFSAGVCQEAVVYQSAMPQIGSHSTTEFIFSDKDVEAPVPVSRTTRNVGRHMIFLQIGDLRITHGLAVPAHYYR